VSSTPSFVVAGVWGEIYVECRGKHPGREMLGVITGLRVGFAKGMVLGQVAVHRTVAGYGHAHRGRQFFFVPPHATGQEGPGRDVTHWFR